MPVRVSSFLTTISTAEGLPEDSWIIENEDWLSRLFTTNNIPSDEAHLRLFYQAVNENDWRCGSCGGCI